MNKHLLNAIRSLATALACGDFDKLESDGRAGGLSGADLSLAIRTYGRTLIPLPDEAIPSIEVYPNDQDPNRLSIDVPLWTAEEGLSDLTLSLSATIDGEEYNLQVDDLHVL